MTEDHSICPECHEAVPPGEGITCYVCGSMFHFSSDKACGGAYPQELAC